MTGKHQWSGRHHFQGFGEDQRQQEQRLFTSGYPKALGEEGSEEDVRIRTGLQLFGRDAISDVTETTQE